MASHQRPYQGYPYVNPPVIDAPSIDAATASKWANLPRKPYTPTKIENQPVVNVNVPEDGPGASAEDVETETQESENASPRVSLPAKKNIDNTPVVYIDMPEGGSDVAQSAEADNNEPEFVQETIFYDPFEDRRIDTTDRAKADETDTGSEASSGLSVRRPPVRPTRPDILNFNAPGTSGYTGQQASSSGMQSSSTSSPALPPILSKEASIYGRTPAEEFSMSPISTSAFPEPPPAYTEFDRVTSPTPPTVEQPRRQSSTPAPPRTQVITPMNQNNRFPPGSSTVDYQIPIGLPNTNRKYLNCHHCGMRVHTLVVRSMGTTAIVVSALCLLICMLPIIFLIYKTSCMKNRNHYCPNCNKLICYQPPCNGDKLVYVN